MSTCSPLPELAQRPADVLAHEILRMDDACRSTLAALVNILAHARGRSLEEELALWLGGKRPGEMARCYNLVRQLVVVAGQCDGEGNSQ